MSQKRRDLVASVRHRLLNLSRDRGEDFQFVLTQYGLERLLYRLTQSPHAGQYVLKGAVLFQLWTGHPHRATRDLDLLGQGTPTPDLQREIFQAVCLTEVEDDGLIYLADSIRADQIKEDDEYREFGCELKPAWGTREFRFRSTLDSATQSRPHLSPRPIQHCLTSRPQSCPPTLSRDSRG